MAWKAWYPPQKTWKTPFKKMFILNGPQNAKMSKSICGQQRPRSASAAMQSDQSLHCLLSESLDTTECVHGKQRSGPSCSKLTMSLVNDLLKIYIK